MDRPAPLGGPEPRLAICRSRENSRTLISRQFAHHYQIASADRAQLLIEINAIIKDIAAWMRKQRHETKGVQAKRLTAAAKAVRKARDLLKVRTDRLVLSFAAKILAPMISPLWLGQRFPADERAPRALGLAPMADDQSSLQQRIRFIESSPVETLVAVFNTIEAGFADSLMMRKSLPGAKGGNQVGTAWQAGLHIPKF
jgi:hypothetical protein